MKVLWLADVTESNYTSALSYLSLKLDDKRAAGVIGALRELEHPQWSRANDILRAAGLAPLGRNDPGVRKQTAKIRAGKQLSPVLVVSFDFGSDIADGYHRVCACYWIDPFTRVPLREAYVPEGVRTRS